MSTAARLRGRIRWSLAVRCPRAASMGLLGYEPAEPTDYMQRIWTRGKQLGDYMAGRFEERYGTQNIVREKAVAWPAGLPIGELHTDIVVVHERLAVEVKSSHTPDSLIDDALRQLAGEIHFDPDVDQGALALIDPIDLAEDILPFVLTEDARDEVEELAATVVTAGQTGVLPPCVCSTPGQCRGKWCPFTDEAWEGWEPPAADKIDGEALTVATEAYLAKQLRDQHKTDADAADTTYREALDRLLELGIQPGRDYHAGPLKIRASAVKGRKTFKLSRAEKLNLWTPADDERFADFMSVGDGHTRWTISRVDDGELALDFGSDVPF